MNRTYFKHFMLFFALMSPAVHAENIKQLPAIPGANLPYPSQIDMEHKDTLTAYTIAELMDDQANEELPLVIAMATTLVPTSTGEAEVRSHFYEGHALSKYLFGSTYYVSIDKKDWREPASRARLSGDIHYFMLENGSEAFSYLGCGSDLCSQSNPNYKNIVNHLVATQSEDLGKRAIAQFAIGEFYTQESHMPEAKRWYTLAAAQTDDLEIQARADVNLAPTSNQFFQLSNGAVCYQAGEIAKAKAWFLLAAQQDTLPTQKAKAQFNLGIICRDNGETENALQWFTRGATQSDNFEVRVDSTLQLGIIELAQGDIGEAKESFLFVNKQSNDPATKAVAHDYLGDICKAQKDLNAALHWYSLAANQSANPGVKIWAQYDLGVTWYELGNTAAAIKWLTCVSDQSTMPVLQAKARSIIGDIYYGLNRLTEATDYLTLAAEQSVALESKANAQYNLGVICQDAGKLTEANNWMRLAANQTDAPEVQLKAQANLASQAQDFTHSSSPIYTDSDTDSDIAPTRNWQRPLGAVAATAAVTPLAILLARRSPKLGRVIALATALYAGRQMQANMLPSRITTSVQNNPTLRRLINPALQGVTALGAYLILDELLTRQGAAELLAYANAAIRKYRHDRIGKPC